MKKIVIYLNSMSSSGGIERVISNLLQDWIKTYELYLITKDNKDSFYPVPKIVKRISIELPLILNMHNRVQRVVSVTQNTIKSREKLKRIIDSIEPDFIYTTTPISAYEVFSLGKKYRDKLVASEHGSYYAYNKVYAAIKRLVYPRIFCVSVPNKMDTDIYLSWGCNAVYIPHQVTFKISEPNRLNSKVILNVGRLTLDKQQSQLIELWSSIKDRKNWTLWIVGDGEEYENIQSHIERNNLHECIKLLPAQKNIQDIFKKASLFAHCSRAEGFGMVLLEAMSFGIPCISFDCPSGPRDIIKDGINGFLIENNNWIDYKKRLEGMISLSEEQLKTLGDEALNTVVAWDNSYILKKWQDVFK